MGERVGAVGGLERVSHFKTAKNPTLKCGRCGCGVSLPGLPGLPSWAAGRLFPVHVAFVRVENKETQPIERQRHKGEDHVTTEAAIGVIQLQTKEYLQL